MKTAGSGHGQTDQLADDRPKTTERQAFLHRGQNILVFVAFAIDDAIRVKSGLCHGRREQVRPRQAPENLSLGARRNSGREQSSGRTVDGARTTAGNLMQRTERKTSAGKLLINQPDTERQRASPASGGAFKMRDPVSKIIDQS